MQTGFEMLQSKCIKAKEEYIGLNTNSLDCFQRNLHVFKEKDIKKFKHSYNYNLIHFNITAESGPSVLKEDNNQSQRHILLFLLFDQMFLFIKIQINTL